MIARVIDHQGSPFLSIDGVLKDPVSFRSFRPEEKTVEAFAQAGVELMSVFPSGIPCSLGVPYSQFGEIWLGEGRYDFDALDRQIRLFRSRAPEALLSLMIHLDTRDWWLRGHPEYLDTFTHLTSTVGDPLWRDRTDRYVQDLVGRVEERHGDRFYAYFLFCGSTCEWMSRIDDGLWNGVKERAYRTWRVDGERDMPQRAELRSTGNGIFRDPVRQRAALDYWRFHNDVVADAILHFCGLVKRLTEGNKLTGVFFGYLGNLGNAVLHKAHLSCGKVFASPDVDILFAPADYMLRRLGCTGAFMQPVDSLRLHGKLYFHEIDNTTHLAPEPYATQLQRAHYRCRDERESVAVMRREFVMATVKQAGLWWFDMFGGWFDSPVLMREISGMRRITALLRGVRMRSASQVAVFVDPESFYYMDGDSSAATSLIARQREALGRMGTPYDFYALEDLFHPAMPLGQYRLLVFLNAFRLPDGLRSVLDRAERDHGASVLWVHAAGYVGKDGLSAAHMESAVGVRFRELPRGERSVCLAPGSPWNPSAVAELYGFEEPIRPVFTFGPGSVEVAGTWEKSGEPAAFAKPGDRGFTFYSGAGNLPAAALRGMARRAGAHVYTEDGCPFYANDSLLGLHVPDGGAVDVRLPEDADAEDLFDGGGIRCEGRVLRVRAEAGTVKLYRILPTGNAGIGQLPAGIDQAPFRDRG